MSDAVPRISIEVTLLATVVDPDGEVNERVGGMLLGGLPTLGELAKTPSLLVSEVSERSLS